MKAYSRVRPAQASIGMPDCHAGDRSKTFPPLGADPYFWDAQIAVGSPERRPPWAWAQRVSSGRGGLARSI